MNNFANTTNSSAVLKDVYSAGNAMKDAIKNRKAKLINNNIISNDPNYSSKPIESDETEENP